MPLAEQLPEFGLAPEQRPELEADIDLMLAPVLARDEPRLDLAEVLAYFDRV